MSSTTKKISWITSTSIGDAASTLDCDLAQPEGPGLSVKDLEKAIEYEMQQGKRKSMIKLLETHIRKRGGGKPEEVKAQLMTKEETEAMIVGNLSAMAVKAHQVAAVGGAMLLVGAVASGLYLQRLKEFVPHGEFTAWVKKHLPGIPLTTGRRYMRIVDELKEQRPEAWESVRRLLPESPKEKKLNNALVRKLAPQLSEITEAQTIADLSRELGLSAPRNTKARRALDKMQDNTGNTDDDNERLAAEWLGTCRSQFSQAGYYRHQFQADPLMRQDLVTGVAELCLALDIHPDEIFNLGESA